MPIVQQGSINTTALVVPDLYVQIVPPQNLVLNGVPTDIIGVVGTAQWGPVGQAVTFGTMAEYFTSFGALQARKYDMGTAVAVAVQQGAQDFVGVRVTDGSDTPATIPLVGNTSAGVLLTALYTGTLGNGIVATLGAGSKAGSWSLTIAAPGMTPENYNNITGSGATFWSNLVAAVNSGTGVSRGPSQMVLASAVGTYTTAPAAGSVTLAGGTDGATNITAATLVGVDGTSRTGMYELRGQGCSIGVLADADDATQWTTQAAFGLSEGVYMMLVCPAGSVISNGVNGSVDLKAAAGLDSYACKLMHGDWLWWTDAVNNTVRLVSPQGFVAGRLANLSPEQSSLNKQIYSVVGSQKSGVVGSQQQSVYSEADMTLLFQNGIDVICNPQPGGSYWGVRLGHNSSSNAATGGDNYTRLTNYLAATLAAGLGLYVGMVINAQLLQNIRATQLSFLRNMLAQGMLAYLPDANGNPTVLPYTVVCDFANNPQTQTQLGIVQSSAAITYQAINEKFLCNIQGGVTVVQPTSQAALAAQS